MTGSFFPISGEPLAYGGSVADGPVISDPVASFDIFDTVISQYANSPVLLGLIGVFRDYVDPSANLDEFYRLIWDVGTAQGYGLDVWGRIVGISRVLAVPNDDFLGFEEALPGSLPFNQGVFYVGTGLTSNFALSDTAYRRLIIAKALANICDGSIPSINRILMALFPANGNCYVQDNGDMTIVFVFETALSPVEYVIAAQSGVLPRPTGVTATVSNG